MTLNCILCRSNSLEDLGSMEYIFMAIIPRSTQTRSGSIFKLSSMGQVDLFDKYK